MRSLNVIVDGRPLVGNRTGIGVHTAEIARRLDVEPPPLIASHAAIEDRTGLESLRFRVDPLPLGVLWQQTRLASIARDGVLWGPHGTLPLSLRSHAVATLHDFSSITMPQRHRLKTIFSFNLFIARSLELANRIAAVSRAVADEAVRGFGVSPAKIEIVPNGVDEFFSPAPSSRKEDFILFTGTMEPRKGLHDLVAAWRSLPQPRPRLVLCGDAGWGVEIEREPDIEVTGFVTRERLRELYQSALAFVYPSHYEGFGIPPLEALACGAPVIATTTGAIPEYAKGAALLVAPRDVEALASALRRLVGDRGLRADLSAAGPERARLYRWDRSAALMTQLLAEATR